jgi:hypothetical protein
MKSIPLSRQNRSDITKSCADTLRTFVAYTIEENQCFELLAMLMRYTLDFSSITDPLLPLIKQSLESNNVLQACSSYLCTMAGISRLIAHSMLVKLMPLAFNSNHAVLRMSRAKQSVEYIFSFGLFDVLLHDYIEGEKSRLMIWLPDVERLPSKYATGVNDEHVLLSILRSPYVLEFMTADHLEKIMTMITNSHALEEERVIGLTILQTLYESDLHAPDVLERYGIMKIIGDMYSSTLYMDQLKMFQERILKLNVFLNGHGDLDNSKSISQQADLKALETIRRKLVEKLSKKIKKETKSNFSISKVAIERAITYAINIGIDKEEKLRAEIVSFAPKYSKDWWLAYSTYLIVRDADVVWSILGSVNIQEQKICELVERELYEKHPSSWGWFATHEDKKHFSHYVTRWIKNFFLGDLPFGHVAEILYYCTVHGWDTSLTKVCCFLMEYTIKKGSILELPIGSLQAALSGKVDKTQ